MKGIESEKVLLRQKNGIHELQKPYMNSTITDIWLSFRLSDEEFLMKLLSTETDKTVSRGGDHAQGSSPQASHHQRRKFSLPKDLKSRMIMIIKDSNELRLSLGQSTILYALFLYICTVWSMS